MDNYKPNSHTSKEKDKDLKEKKIEKVVKGNVKIKKKSGLSKLFISEDIVDIKSYVMFDVLVPAAKKAISDIVTNGIDMLLYGETSRGRKSPTSSRISYRSYYDRDDRDRDRDRDKVNSRSSMYSYEDITLESRVEAEEVLNRLDELIDVYGMASVSDLYDLVGKSGLGRYTDCDYGWTNLRTATHVRVRDGYKLKLPRATPL